MGKSCLEKINGMARTSLKGSPAGQSADNMCRLAGEENQCTDTSKKCECFSKHGFDIAGCNTQSVVE